MAPPAPASRILPFFVVVLPVLVAVIVLGIAWSSLPESWPTHWNREGTADGFGHRTLVSTFGPLLLSAPLVVVLETIGWVTRRSGSARPELQPVRDATAHLLRWIALAQTISISAIVVALPLRFSMAPGSIAVIFVLLLGLAITAGALRYVEALREVRSSGEAARGYSTLFYKNDEDERLWVPKLVGAGYTLNFAHPWAWPVMVLRLAIPLGFAALAIAMTR